jgi:integrase
MLFTALAKPLEEAISACGGYSDLAFLRNYYGKKFASGNALGNWFKDRCVEAGIPHCSAHGLRKAGASLVAEEGASDMTLDAMFAWSQSGDNNQSRTYTRNASKLRLATEGFAILERVLARHGIISPEHGGNRTVSVFDR